MRKERAIRPTRAALIGVVVAAIAVGGCGGSSSGGSSGGGQSLKVGAMFDQSGPFASLGGDQKKAFNLMVKQVNASGPIKLDATVEDSQTQVSRAVQLAQQFINDGDQVIFGPTSNAACKAVQQVTERASVATYCFTGGPLNFTPHVFSGEYDPVGGLADVPLKFFKSKGWTKIGCLSTADASGQSYSVPLKQEAPKYGAKVVAEETFQPGATDVVSQLTKIRAAHPDVLYACASGSNLVPIARGVVQLGWNVPVYAGLGAVSYDVVNAVKSYIPKGGLFSDGSWVMAPDSAPAGYPGKHVLQKFVTDFKQTNGTMPSILAADVADSVRIVEEAAKNAGGDLKGDSMASQIEKLHNFPGILSTYTFGPNRHRGTTVPQFILSWKGDGTVHPVAKLGG